MLYYVTRRRTAKPLKRLLSTLETSWLGRPDFVRMVTYEALFTLRRAPIANYVFTDMDRLSGYEMDTIGGLVNALEAADPAIHIANRPNRVLGRYQLLRRLHDLGINSYNVWRLDEERAPDAYPVFLRREHDAFGPESPLLHNEREYRDAVEALLVSGRGLTGRIAVQYVDAVTARGHFHKYGAFRFGSRIVPQHLMMAHSWIVKRAATDLEQDSSEEELQYALQNPHREQLARIFDLAQIECGRIDYCVANGRIEVFEINTNPNFPRARTTDDRRMIKRKIVVEGIVDGLRELNAAHDKRGQVSFAQPRPRLQKLRNASIRQRTKFWWLGQRWNREFGPVRS